jgi:hypothetical protein
MLVHNVIREFTNLVPLIRISRARMNTYCTVKPSDMFTPNNYYRGSRYFTPCSLHSRGVRLMIEMDQINGFHLSQLFASNITVSLYIFVLYYVRIHDYGLVFICNDLYFQRYVKTWSRDGVHRAVLEIARRTVYHLKIMSVDGDWELSTLSAELQNSEHATTSATNYAVRVVMGIGGAFLFSSHSLVVRIIANLIGEPRDGVPKRQDPQYYMYMYIRSGWKKVQRWWLQIIILISWPNGSSRVS